MGEGNDARCEPRSDIVCLEGNGYRPSHKGDGYRVGGAMYTLNETEVHAVCYAVGVDLYNQTMTGGVSKTLNNRATDADHVPCVICYGISAYESNAMKSSNPHSGIYIAETSRTLDFNGGNPACNQVGGGACAVHQNGSGEVQMSEVGYTVSTNSNASGRNTPIVLVYESHNQDSRYNPFGEVCETVSAKYGTGVGQLPILIMREAESEVCGKESTETLPERSTPTTSRAAGSEKDWRER